MRLGPFDVPGYHVGDCRELLRQLPDESVNCVVTSPPYWALRDYGVVGQLGLERTPDEYVATMVDVFREVRRVLRADGTLWLNLGDSYATGAGRVGECPVGGDQGARWTGDKRGYRGDRLANGRGDQPSVLRVKTRSLRDGSHAGKHTAMAAMGPMNQPNRMPLPGLKPKDLIGIPWKVAFALQADGWWLRSDIVWHKPNPMPESVTDRPTKAHEYVFLLSKSERYHYDSESIRERRVAPQASTPEDAARAFSRRRSVTPDPYQGPLAPRRSSGNKERKQREFSGGIAGSPNRQAFGVPWEGEVGNRNKRSVWTVATEPTADAHFATFPRKLVEPCILAGCPAGGVVLDPFGGSGTVGRVAEDHGRRWILFDLNPAYAKIAKRKTAQTGLLMRAAKPGALGGPVASSEAPPMAVKQIADSERAERASNASSHRKPAIPSEEGTPGVAGAGGPSVEEGALGRTRST